MKRSAPKRSVGLKPSAIPLVRTPLKENNVSRKRQKLGALTQAKRERIYRRDDDTCQLGCGAIVGPGRKRRTIDHKTPVARGGGNEDSNLVTACWSCNMAKGDMTLAEWCRKR